MIELYKSLQERHLHYYNKLVKYKAYVQASKKYLNINVEDITKMTYYSLEITRTKQLLDRLSVEYQSALMVLEVQYLRFENAELRARVEQKAREKELVQQVLLNQDLLGMVLSRVEDFSRRQLARVCKAWRNYFKGEPEPLTKYSMHFHAAIYSESALIIISIQRLAQISLIRNYVPHTPEELCKNIKRGIWQAIREAFRQAKTYEKISDTYDVRRLSPDNWTFGPKLLDELNDQPFYFGTRRIYLTFA